MVESTTACTPHRESTTVFCPTPGCGKLLPVCEINFAGSTVLYCRHCKKRVRISVGSTDSGCPSGQPDVTSQSL